MSGIMPKGFANGLPTPEKIKSSESSFNNVELDESKRNVERGETTYSPSIFGGTSIN
jgi:hypothetical protein